MKTGAYLIDRDGVLNFAKDGTVIPGAAYWVETLVEREIPFLIATNHTTSGPEEGAADLRRLGFPVRNQHMHTPLTILFDAFERFPPGRIYARGTPKLLNYLLSKGVTLVDDDHADTVLLGFDQNMDYRALCTAIHAIMENGARFIALHENRLFKGADGRIEPGLGAWVRAIEYATATTALIIGKPAGEYYRAALARLGSVPGETTMISDDPLGDLSGAKREGIRTVFVTSGKYRDLSVLDSVPDTLKPDLVLSSIVDLELI